MTTTKAITPEDWVATEDCDTIWLRGHIYDRDTRRRALESVVNGELGWSVPFMELVLAARDHRFVWMRLEPAPEGSEWHGGDWYKEYDHDGDGMMPYTRINVDDHIL